MKYTNSISAVCSQVESIALFQTIGTTYSGGTAHTRPMYCQVCFKQQKYIKLQNKVHFLMRPHYLQPVRQPAGRFD
jgi:hypothetical protein